VCFRSGVSSNFNDIPFFEEQTEGPNDAVFLQQYLVFLRSIARPMNTMGSATSSAFAYMYIRLYTYIMLHCTYTVDMYIMYA